MSPEEIEIQQKQLLIRQLEQELMEIDAEFAYLTLEVEVFEREYLTIMAPLYANLDRWNLRIACTGLVIDRLRDVRDGLRPLPTDPFEWSASSIEDARSEWTRRHEPSLTSNREEKEIPKQVLQDARELYRQLAKRYHPDLVSDSIVKEQRTLLMAEINEAYQQRDLPKLREFLKREPLNDPQEESSGDVLVRLIRRVAHLQAQIDLAHKRVQEEKKSELIQLFEQCREAEQVYGDPFHILKATVAEQVQRAKREWMIQRARESKLWTEVEP